MNKKDKKIKVGGVALYNGIIFTSDYRQVIAQQYGDSVRCKINSIIQEKKIIYKIPILRGILGIGNQIGNAIPTFVESSGEKNNDGTIKTVLLYAILAIFCISVPLVISLIFSSNIRNIIQAIIIALEFILYIVMLKSIPELDIIFMYHGAEHKAVNSFENLSIDEMTLENVKKQSRFHKRCGGNFVVYFVILMMASVFIPIENIFLKCFLLLLFGILNIGIAYEVVNLFSKLKKPFDVINYPATLIQLITTKEPTDSMLKLALYGILGTVRKTNGVTPSEYIKKYTKENLSDISYDNQDIYSILEYVTGINRNNLILQNDSYLISINNEIKADMLLNKYYFNKYPLQYITHVQYFYKEKYYVDENVLIPRADSEILVEKAIEYIENEKIKNGIDLCTGSGALGISVAKNSDIENITLMDISQKALNVAKRNIVSNGMQNKVTIQKSDLLSEKIKEINENRDIEDKRVDLIISNPPYIKTDVLSTLQEEVKKEPKLALDGGKDGLDFYNRIIKEAKEVLKPNGIIIFEIGYDQLDDIKHIVNENKEFKMLESFKDYGGNDRVVICRFQDK